jgi:DNA-binding NarL/FixJ family response regulator
VRPGVRVLLCFERATVRTGLERLLGGIDGIDVVATAQDGDEGLDAATRLHPDVVLMDLSMPRVDGVATTRRISAEVPAARVVVLTSMPVRSRIRQALDAGATGYLFKDATPSELVASIRAAVGTG